MYICVHIYIHICLGIYIYACDVKYINIYDILYIYIRLPKHGWSKHGRGVPMLWWFMAKYLDLPGNRVPPNLLNNHFPYETCHKWKHAPSVQISLQTLTGDAHPANDSSIGFSLLYTCIYTCLYIYILLLSKPWYPDGSLSHSWLMDGFPLSHMVLVGFDRTSPISMYIRLSPFIPVMFQVNLWDS